MSEVQRTLVLLKPDAYQRGFIGAIISRFEKKGLILEKMELMNLSVDKAVSHYAEHEGKDFYNNLIAFITSDKLVALILSGISAVHVVRIMCGATNSAEAEAGTIRGDYSLSNSRNIIHSSDSAESAQREIDIFFPI